MCTTAAETGGGSLIAIAEVGGQHINELRVCRRLQQRMSCDPIKQAVIRLSPAGLHKGAQVSFHTVACGAEMLRCLLIEPLCDQ